TQDSSVVKQVYGLTNVISVAAGCSHSIALKDDGTVWVWGYGPAAGLDQGSSVPRQVYGLTDVVGIAAGNYHSLALKRDGTVWAWGQNNEGQLGDGTKYNNRYEPVQVAGLSDVVAIAGGGGHSLALKNDGTVWAWGWNQDGQLGDGTTTSTTTPVQVAGLSNVVVIAAGERHSLALRGDGTVWAWGYNGYGQLGDGTTDNRLTPAQVPGLSGIISIAAGIYHSLALKSDGTVWAWGYNEMGQLGIGTWGQGEYKTYPAQSVTIPPTVSFAADADIVTFEDSESVTFTVYLTGGTLSTDLTVYYTVGSTATPGVDYVVPSGSVTIPAGQTSAPIEVTLFDDSEPEGDETIILTLTEPSCIVGSPSSAVLTITDNDNAGGGGETPMPVVTITATDPDASEPGTDTGMFTVIRTGDMNSELIVDYKVGGTAIAGSDYVALLGSVTIPPKESSATIPVIPIDDPIVESTETVIVTLYPHMSSCYKVGSPSSAVVSIADNDKSSSSSHPGSSGVLIKENQAPVVTITSPGNNASFKKGEVLLITASATDDQAVSRMELSINGFRKTESYGSIISYRWDTGRADPGIYTIRVDAWDNLGKSSSNEITVTIKEVKGEIKLINPVDKAILTVGETVTISAEGSGISYVKFYVIKQ
ncbi:MAG: hypothetical protein K6U74_15935, partial [Firmicutes bacterium]|nr:hypothetical protein [Bacillota bacterium]